METVLEAALHCAEHAGAQREVSTILLALSRAALVGPRPVDAAIARVQELGDRLPGMRPALRAEGEYLLAALEAMRGNGEEARRLIESGKRTLEEFGLNVRLASVQMYAAWVELSSGDPEAAERELRPAYESLARMGERSYLSTLAGVLAAAVYEQGRFEEADRVARAGEAWASCDDIGSQVNWRGVAAKVAAQRGEYDVAERLARKGVSLASKTDFMTMQAAAWGDLAEVLRLVGRDGDARAAFRQTAELYDAKGNSVAARRVRERLGDVEGGRRVDA
jgi:ATP/maltotriose-dependent transcriptional regulator MalT